MGHWGFVRGETAALGSQAEGGGDPAMTIRNSGALGAEGGDRKRLLQARVPPSAASAPAAAPSTERKCTSSHSPTRRQSHCG